MKKIKLLAFILLCGLITPLVFTGCNNEKPTLSLEQNFKTYYVVGESLDVSEGILKYTANGDEDLVAVKNDMIGGFSSETAGTRTMIVSYEGEQLQIEYKVFEHVVSGAWYRSTDLDGMYLYVSVYINDKTLVGFTATEDNFANIDLNSVNKFTYQYAQMVDSEGIKLNIVQGQENRVGIIEISNISRNGFNLSSTLLENDVVVESGSFSTDMFICS